MNVKIIFFAVALLLDADSLCAVDKPNTVPAWQIAATVGRLLEEGQYSRWTLGPEMSQRILETYLEDLDYDKAFLTQADVNQLSAEYGTHLGEKVLLGDLGPAKAIYDVFKARVESRIVKIRQLLRKDYTFTSNRFVDQDRRKKRWPAEVDQADLLWRDKIENELLQEKLDRGAVTESGREVVARRYDGLLKGVEDRGEEEIDEIFLNAVAESYDPHSEYMGHSNLESFEIDMRLSLVGIGAEMRSEDGYVKIERLVPGRARREERQTQRPRQNNRHRPGRKSVCRGPRPEPRQSRGVNPRQKRNGGPPTATPGGRRRPIQAACRRARPRYRPTHR